MLSAVQTVARKVDANLKELQTIYPEYGMYLAMLGLKTQFPVLKGYWS